MNWPPNWLGNLRQTLSTNHLKFGAFEKEIYLLAGFP